MPGKPLDSSRVMKRAFELKLKLKLKRESINYAKLTTQEKLYFRIRELKKRENQDLCPACLGLHFASPPDDCWLFIAKCENSELRELFEGLCRRKRWAQFS